jgi:hypothetical protein
MNISGVMRSEAVIVASGEALAKMDSHGRGVYRTRAEQRCAVDLQPDTRRLDGRTDRSEITQFMDSNESVRRGAQA